MKTLFIIFVFFAAISLNGQTSIYHFQKLKAAEGQLKKTEREGSWQFWSYLGYPLKVENYKNGKLHGKSVYYKTDNSDMDISTREEMIKNKELYELRLKRQKAFTQNEAEWNLLLKNNFYIIEKVIHYKEGKIDTVNVYENNKFKEQIFYPYADTSNYMVRTYKPYSYRDSVNKIIEEITYRKGMKNGPFKKYNTKYNDEIMSSGFYLDDKKDSVWLWEKDNVKELIRYKEGKRHGLSETYRFKTCTDSALYVNGKKEGLCKSSKRDYGSKTRDTLLTYSTYSNGKLNGTQTVYKKGRPVEISNYKDWGKHGAQIMFFDNGDLKKEAFFKNGKRDSTHQYWDEKKNLKSYALYRNDVLVKEDYYYEAGKLRSHFEKTGENSLEVKYYANGKKRKQTEKTPTKETFTTWDENGKKDVRIIDKKKYFDDLKVPIEVQESTVGMKDYGRDKEGEVEEVPYKSKYDKYRPKLDKNEKKNSEYGKAYFKGGENEQKEFLNLMTKNDKRESSPEAFYVQTAITVSETGEITYVKASEIKKVKKKYLKEAERIVLMMPKWKPALKAGQPTIENTGFNVWFSEKK